MKADNCSEKKSKKTLKNKLQLTQEIHELRQRISELESLLNKPNSTDNESNKKKFPTVGHWEYYPSQKKFIASENAKKIYGFNVTRNEFSINEIKSCIPKINGMAVAFSELVQHGKEFNHLYNIKPQNSNNVKTVHSFAWAEKDANDLPKRIIGVIQDLSETNKNAQIQNIGNERYYNFFHDDLSGDFIAKPDGTIVLCNLSYARIFGFNSVEEVMESKHQDAFIDPKEHKEFIELIKEKRELINYETIRKRKNLEKIYIQENLIGKFDNDGNLLEFKGYVIDITARKHAEKKIQESEKMLQRVIDLLPIRIYWKDLNLKFLGCNTVFAKDNNLNQPQELIGKTEADLNFDECTNFYNDEESLVLETGNDKMNIVNSYANKDGIKKWLKTSTVPLTNIEGKTIGVLGAYEDITEIIKREEELIKSHDDYRLFFENDLTGDFISSAEGILLDCNPSFVNIMGFPSKEEAIGTNLIKLYANSDTRKKILELLNNNKKINNHEYEMIRFDGKPIQLISNIFGIFNESDELVRIQGYVFDNTEKKIALEKIRKLSRAVEQSPAAIMITDLKGNIEYVNEKYLQVTKFNQEEVIGKNASIQKSGHTNIGEYKALWNTINSGNEWSGEFLNKKKDGSLYWESALISPIRNQADRITHFLAIKEDITEKKEYEQKLILARDKAEESDRLKTAFLNTMSHELRTPLNAIIGFSSLVSEKSSINKIIQFNQYIYQSGIQLEKIIENIFEFSSIEAGLTKLSEEEIKLKDFFLYINEVIHNEKVKRGKKEIQLLFNHQDTDIKIFADKNKLSQVLLNLLVNALKFTNHGTIELGFSVENTKDLILFVKDTGIGIPKHMHAKIFERFTQISDNILIKNEGIGLGLAISSKLIKMMGGNIWLASEPDNGSTFYTLLPNSIIVDSLNTTTKNSKEPTYDFSKSNILIVEDVATNYVFLEHLLKKFNANIYWAQNGKEAINMVLNNRRIDLILMDLKIPLINGIEATKKIKMTNPEIPVFAISAQTKEDHIKNTIEAGCDEFISKPVDSQELLTLLRKYL